MSLDAPGWGHKRPIGDRSARGHQRRRVIGRGEDIESLPVTSDGRVPVASLVGKSLAWFFEDRAPGFAHAIIRDLHASGWVPELVQLDPASTSMIEDALLRRTGLVMLRPEQSALRPDLAWAMLTPPIVERLSLLCRS